MRIPEVRDAFRELFANAHCPADISRRGLELIEELYRRPAPRVTAPRSAPMTRERRDEIKRFAREHPTWSHQQLASKFKVNSGRISEALNGKRK